MITLQCDMCGYKCGWYSTTSLPEKWRDIEGKELCENCATKYKEFREALDEEVRTKIDEYFGKEKK